MRLGLLTLLTAIAGVFAASFATPASAAPAGQTLAHLGGALAGTADKATTDVTYRYHYKRRYYGHRYRRHYRKRYYGHYGKRYYPRYRKRYYHYKRYYKRH